MGGSDSLSQAQSFASAYGGPTHLLWGDSSEAWTHYRSGNPNLILLDGAGNEQIERVSRFDAGRLQDALDRLT